MSRNLGLPYKPTNPRTVRGAKKRGWIVIDVDLKYVKDTSWLGLNIWCDRQMSGYWVSSFMLREFAFENGKDAMLFKLKWG
jgi:hypothetical protein